MLPRVTGVILGEIMFEDHIDFFKNDKENSSAIVFNRPEYNGEETYENHQELCEPKKRNGVGVQLTDQQEKMIEQLTDYVVPVINISQPHPITARPSWDNIPDKYKWMAQDSDGEWFVYIDEPEIGEKMWSPSDFSNDCACRVKIENWEQTLERRPE
jgi:hypothetical protein